MHFSVLLLVSATTVLAAPGHPYDAYSGLSRRGQLVARGAKGDSARTIMGNLGMVQASVDSLDAAVVQVNSNPDTAKALVMVASKSAALGDMLKAAQSNIQSVDETGLNGAIRIKGSAKALGVSLDKLSDDLISIEPKVRKAGLDGAVLGVLKQQQTASDGLSGMVTEKVPKGVRNIAKKQSAGLAESLARVVDVYEKGAAAPKPARK